jgi:hypothetical protein
MALYQSQVVTEYLIRGFVFFFFIFFQKSALILSGFTHQFTSTKQVI